MGLATPWCRVKDEEIVIHLLVNLHYSSFVAAAIAVVRCGENCHNLFFMTPIVSLLTKIERLE